MKKTPLCVRSKRLRVYRHHAHVSHTNTHTHQHTSTHTIHHNTTHYDHNTTRRCRETETDRYRARRQGQREETRRKTREDTRRQEKTREDKRREETREERRFIFRVVVHGRSQLVGVNRLVNFVDDRDLCLLYCVKYDSYLITGINCSECPLPN